jgi:hypothetical protein
MQQQLVTMLICARVRICVNASGYDLPVATATEPRIMSAVIVFGPARQRRLGFENRGQASSTVAGAWISCAQARR